MPFTCQHWRVMITGASSGIGAACARQFAAAGAHLLLWARRDERLQTLATELRTTHGVDIETVSLDIQSYDAIHHAWSQLPEPWHDIDVLVNNAGLALGLDTLDQGDPKHWDTMIDTNIKGLLYLTRHVLPDMIRRQRGHIVNLGSISAYDVYRGGAVYCATKFAVRALTEGIKIDVHGTPIRTTLINPGMVETEFSQVRFSGDAARAQSVYANIAPLTPDDIADTILYCVTRPPHVDVRELSVFPTAQTASWLVHRE